MATIVEWETLLVLVVVKSWTSLSRFELNLGRSSFCQNPLHPQRQRHQSLGFRFSEVCSLCFRVLWPLLFFARTRVTIHTRMATRSSLSLRPHNNLLYHSHRPHPTRPSPHCSFPSSSLPGNPSPFSFHASFYLLNFRRNGVFIIELNWVLTFETLRRVNASAAGLNHCVVSFSFSFFLPPLRQLFFSLMSPVIFNLMHGLCVLYKSCVL